MDGNNQMLESVIIGGGIAGLSCANRLAEKGGSPLLIDGGIFPCHKVCGEFFSHDCHQILKRWNLLPEPEIISVIFHAKHRSYRFKLPSHARGESRFQFDQKLLMRAISHGAEVATNTKVVKIAYLDQALYPYQIHLEEGKTLASKKLFVGAGRIAHLIFNSPPPKMQYVGVKRHFEGIALENTLHMFFLPGGYLGVSPIEEGRVNIAGLFLKQCVGGLSEAENYLEKCFSESPGNKLKELLGPGTPLFRDWLVTEVPEFSKSRGKEEHFQNLFLIGDAKATIPPASGAGLSMGITSGWMAAEFSFEDQGKNYQAAWQSRYNTRLRWASLLHRLMLHPTFGKFILNASVLYPPLFRMFFHKIRDVDHWSI